MKILVLGGTHGNELLGIELVRSLRKNPIPDVDAMIANPRAVRARKRFVEADLNRSFDSDTSTYEAQRAQKLRDITRKYDIVLDFHNTMTSRNNCSFVGASPDKRLLEVSAQLGLQRCISATYDCINKWCPNTLSVEISLDDALDNIGIWRKRIRVLQEGANLSNKPVELYRYIGRCSWEQKRKISDRAWLPFQKLSVAESRKLGYAEAVYPIFVGSKLTEFYATILEKIKE